MWTDLISRADRIGAIAMTFAVTGCALGNTHQPYEHSYPIGVTVEAQILEIPTEPRLSPQAARDVEAFARFYRRVGESQITVAYPAGQSVEAMVSDVIARIHKQGVTPSRLDMGGYSTEADGDRGVVLSFYASEALVAQCPQIWGETTMIPSNAKSVRLGCAHRNNLAAMIARPRDLIRPRAPTPPDAIRRGIVLSSYRQGGATDSEQSGDKTETTN
jgi:pilus assembly protein CpaD